MEQIFVKRIQGHELEFNRQHYPESYVVSIKDFNQEGAILTLKKDDKGMWEVNQSTAMPVWFNEISLDVHYAIEETENKLSGTPNITVSSTDTKIKNLPKTNRLYCLH